MTFFTTVSQCFLDNMNELLTNGDACGGYCRRFSFPEGVQWVVYHDNRQSFLENIGFWRGTHVLGSFSVSQLSEYCVSTEMRKKCSPPCKVQ